MTHASSSYFQQGMRPKIFPDISLVEIITFCFTHSWCLPKSFTSHCFHRHYNSHGLRSAKRPSNFLSQMLATYLRWALVLVRQRYETIEDGPYCQHHLVACEAANLLEMKWAQKLFQRKVCKSRDFPSDFSIRPRIMLFSCSSVKEVLSQVTSPESSF